MGPCEGDDPSDDYVLDVSVHVLQGPEDYLPILNRHGQTDPPGTRFACNNGGQLMLALAIERAAGRPTPTRSGGGCSSLRR